jgi:hypothetical protein
MAMKFFPTTAAGRVVAIAAAAVAGLGISTAAFAATSAPSAAPASISPCTAGIQVPIIPGVGTIYG